MDAVPEETVLIDGLENGVRCSTTQGSVSASAASRASNLSVLTVIGGLAIVAGSFCLRFA